MRALTAGYLCAETALPSPGIDEIRWEAPVRAGDAVAVRARVLEARPSRSRPDRGLLRTRVEAFNQDGTRVLQMATVSVIRCRTGGNTAG